MSMLPNCLVPGFVYYSCEICGSEKYEEIGYGDHRFEDEYGGGWELWSDPTCTEDGLKYRECLLAGCDYVEYEVWKPALGHDYQSATIEPTVESEGYTLYTCERCGDNYKDNYVERLQPVSVAGISIDRASANLIVGDNLSLCATVSPDNATNKSVFWGSSNTNVAQVDSYGTVTAVGVGTATITVTTEDGGFSAVCEISVTAPPLKADIGMGVVFSVGEGGASQYIGINIYASGGVGPYTYHVTVFRDGEYIGEIDSNSIQVSPCVSGTYTVEATVWDSIGNQVFVTETSTFSLG